MSGEGRKRPPSIAEFLFGEIRSAFQDMRQKVLEEGWFGRVVTPAPVIEVGRESPESIGLGDGLGERRPSFEELWAPREREPNPTEIQKPHGHDLDR